MGGCAIGEAAERTGCTVATIRYYEDLGLLRPISRSASGRRVYGWPDIERLRLIRRLRAMDFGLDSVRQFVDALDARSPNCLDIRDLAAAHLETIRERREEIEALERSLERMTATCTPACATSPTPDCTIIDDIRAMGGQAGLGQAGRGP